MLKLLLQYLVHSLDEVRELKLLGRGRGARVPFRSYLDPANRGEKELRAFTNRQEPKPVFPHTASSLSLNWHHISAHFHFKTSLVRR